MRTASRYATSPGRCTRRAAEKIAQLTALPASLMPEGLLSGLDDAALRDLFAYLMKP
jgi:hypothetical protein